MPPKAQPPTPPSPPLPPYVGLPCDGVFPPSPPVPPAPPDAVFETIAQPINFAIPALNSAAPLAEPPAPPTPPASPMFQPGSPSKPSPPLPPATVLLTNVLSEIRKIPKLHIAPPFPEP